MDDLPIQPGTYAVVLELVESRNLKVGHLGGFGFPVGYYVYLGSARGPGGLRARLSRHLRWVLKPYWHIDYLVASALLRGYAYVVFGSLEAEPGPTECAWSQAVLSMSDAAVPVSKFGASDCRSGCPAHLVHFPDKNFLGTLPVVLNLTGDTYFFINIIGTDFYGRSA